MDSSELHTAHEYRTPDGKWYFRIERTPETERQYGGQGDGVHVVVWYDYDAGLRHFSDFYLKDFVPATPNGILADAIQERCEGPSAQDIAEALRRAELM